MLKSLLGALVLAAAVLLTAPLATARETGDEAKVAAAWDAMLTGGYPDLGEHADELASVLSHAPTGFSRIEEREGRIVYRAQDEEDLAGFTAWSAERRKASGLPPKPVAQGPRIYLDASFLLGAYYNEVRQPQAAEKALLVGLKLSPDDALLVSETAVALQQVRRMTEALQLYETALAADTFVQQRDRARLFRGRGFTLIELNRLDEAERDYRSSLELDPDNRGARQEIDYIEGRRQGRPPTEMTFPTSEESRQGRDE